MNTGGGWYEGWGNGTSDKLPVIYYPTSILTFHISLFHELSQNCEKRLQLRHVCPSTCNNSAPTGRFSMKFNVWTFFRKSFEKIQVSLKSDKNNERAWFQASGANLMTTALFGFIAQRVVVISYAFLNPEGRTDRLSRNVGRKLPLLAA